MDRMMTLDIDEKRFDILLERVSYFHFRFFEKNVLNLYTFNLYLNSIFGICYHVYINVAVS